MGGLLGSAFAPALLVHAPLVLLGLNPTWRHLFLAATVCSLVPFVVVTTIRRSAAAYLAFKVGQMYGDRTLELIEDRSARIGRWVRAFERLFQRAGHLLLLCAPGISTATMAGASHMRATVTMPLIVAGQIFWMSVAYMVGDAMRHWIDPIVAMIQQNMLLTTLVCVGCVILFSLYRQSARRAQLKAGLMGRPGE